MNFFRANSRVSLYPFNRKNLNTYLVTVKCNLSTNYTNRDPLVSDAEEHKKFRFRTHFYNLKTTEYNAIQEGGYIDVTKEELKKYFPEGLAGDSGK